MRTTTFASACSINRYYDPSTDQFLSVDLDVQTTDQPYAFTNDDPLNSTDPLGTVMNDLQSGGYQTPTQEAVTVNAILESEDGPTGGPLGVTPFVTVGSANGKQILILIITPDNVTSSRPITVGVLLTDASTLGGPPTKSTSSNMGSLGLCRGIEAVSGAIGFAGFGDLTIESIAAAPVTGFWSLVATPLGLMGMGISSLGLFGSDNVGPLSCNGRG